MNSISELVVHTCFPKKELCFALAHRIKTDAKGNFSNDHHSEHNSTSTGSYDGDIFHSHTNSKNVHHETTLANFEGSPLAVGGYNPMTNKAETYDISSKTWNEVADYPYHD